MAQPALFLLSGMPGAGKTTFAHALAARTGAEHVESDAIRRSLAAQPTYTAKESGRVFAIVGRRVDTALAAGRNVIVDATNLTNRDRRQFVSAAAAYGARLIAIRVTAPEDVIRERLGQPRVGHSQADVRVFELMRGRAQGFAMPAVVVDTRFGIDAAVSLAVTLAGA
ncbi:MAG: ATP-binding protein [Dehalococcoidia bacterium]